MKKLAVTTLLLCGLAGSANAESLYHKVSGKWDISGQISDSGRASCVASGRYRNEGRISIVADIDQLSVHLVVVDPTPVRNIRKEADESSITLRFFGAGGLVKSYKLAAEIFRNRVISDPISPRMIASWANNSAVEVITGTVRQKVSLAGSRQAANFMFECIKKMRH